MTRACTACTAQLLNLTDLARDAGVATNTAKSWLSILEASGLVYLLVPYHPSVTKRLVKTPKLYFLDSGLCSWLTEWTSPETLEIDLLIARDARLHPVEIKKSAASDRRIAGVFSVLDRLDLERGAGAVVCLASTSLPLTEDVVTVPVGML